MAGRVAEVLEVLAVLLIAVGLVTLPVLAVNRLPAPRIDDGRRYEPPAVVGARVETAHGAGVITARVAYGDGPRWQIRLDGGRHVVMQRAEFRVVSVDG